MSLMKRCVLAAVIVGAGLVPSPKAAATVTCLDGTLCLWAGASQTGQQVNISDRRGVSNKIARKMNNQASSVENDTAFAVFLYDKKDGKGISFCVEPDGFAHDLITFNDLVSSTKVTRLPNCPV